MNKKTRNLVVLSSILAVLLITMILTRIFDRDADSNTAESEQSVKRIEFTAFEPQDLREVTVTSRSGQFTLLSTDGVSWTVTNLPQSFRLDETAPQTLVSTLAALDGRLIDANPENLEIYGLDAPAVEVLISDSTGKNATVLFGNRNPGGDGYYAMEMGNNAVVVVSSVQAEFWAIDQFQNVRLPDIATENIVEFFIRSQGRDIHAVPHSISSDSFLQFSTKMDMVLPWKYRRPMDDYGFQEALKAAPPPTRIADFIKNPPSDPALLGFGTNSDRILIVSQDGARYDLELGRATDNGRRYAREANKPDGIFLLEDQDLGILNLRPFELVSKFVYLAGIEQVGTVTFRGFGEEYILVIERLGDPENDSDDDFTINDQKIPEDDFRSIYGSIIGLLFEGTTEKVESLATPEVTLVFSHVDDSVPDTVIAFHNYDEIYYAVQVNDMESEFIIGRYQVEAMRDDLKEATP